MKPVLRAGILVLTLLAVGCVLTLKRSQSEAAPGDDISTTGAITASGEHVALPRMVDLGAGACIPCKKMKPILEELRVSHAERFEVVFIDVWEHPDQAEPYEIRLIPTQIFYAPDGEELFRHEGFFSREDILAKWDELGFRWDDPTASG